MNKFSAFLAISFISSIFFLSSCNETSNIGASILDQDLLNSEFTDTLSLRLTTVEGDSIVTYFPSVPSSQHPGGFLFGNFNDPVFGSTKSSIYSNIRPSGDPLVLGILDIDSVVLELPYYRDGIYGKFDQPMDIKVHKVDEKIIDQLYYSNQTFAVGSEIASHSFIPNTEDSVTVIVPKDTLITELDANGEPVVDDEGDTSKIATLIYVPALIPPHIRIPLDNSYGEELLSLDPVDYNDTVFNNVIFGLFLETVSEDEGMLALNLSNIPSDGNYAPQIKVTYKTDGNNETYSFPLHGFNNNPKVANIEVDHSGSVAEGIIQDPSLSNEYNFVQGHAGYETLINIPYTEFLDDLSIIKAELELTVIYLPEDDEETYAPIDGLILRSLQGDTVELIIDDATFAIGNQNLTGLFGGNPVETVSDVTGEMIHTYKLNIAAHLNKLRDGLVPNEMILSVFAQAQKPGRVVICGTEHPDYPAKINLYYSK